MLAFSGSFTDLGKRGAILAGESFAWDFGDGNILTGTLTPTHTFADNGSFTVTLTVTDADGGVGSDWLLVTVSNVAPALAPFDDLVVNEGTQFSITGVYTDPGTLDTQTVVIEWQAGVTETLNLPAGSSSFELSHTYAEAGAFTVIVTITDKDGGTAQQSFDVIANPGVEFFLPLVWK